MPLEILFFVGSAILAGLAAGGLCVGLGFGLVWLEDFAKGKRNEQ